MLVILFLDSLSVSYVKAMSRLSGTSYKFTPL